MNDYFIFGTLNYVFTNEKFDSMYGWYGSNAQNMWKIANFGRFLMIFGPFGARYHPLYYTRHPMIDCFTVGTFHNVCSKEKSDSLYGYYGCNGKNVLKTGHFLWFLRFLGPNGPYIAPGSPKHIFLIHRIIGAKLGQNHMQHAMLIPEIHEFSMLVKMRQRAFVWRIFAFISRF